VAIKFWLGGNKKIEIKIRAIKFTLCWRFLLSGAVAQKGQPRLSQSIFFCRVKAQTLLFSRCEECTNTTIKRG